MVTLALPHPDVIPAVPGLSAESPVSVVAARAGLSGGTPAGRLSQADGLRPVRRRAGQRPLRARGASLRLPGRAAGALARSAGAAPAGVGAARTVGARPGRAGGPVGDPVRPGLGAARRRRPSRRSRTALLVGEHANRPDFPPTLFAAEVMGAGGRVWTTLACRDRNRVVLEQELAGLAAVGVDGVLCVTGDGRGVSVRPGVTQVFDLDGVRLAALAAAMGLAVAVPESPEAPPLDLRPARVAEKQRAGAQLCVLNHVSSPARVAAFVAAARAAGATLPFVAGGRRLHRRAVGPGPAAVPRPAPGRRGGGARAGRAGSAGGRHRGCGGRGAGAARDPRRRGREPVRARRRAEAWTTAPRSRPRWPRN